MARSSYKGFRRAASLLQEPIRKASETRGFAVSRVLTHWEEVVGADIASVCRPVDISYGRQGFGATLTVLTTGAQAPMLEMQKERMRVRINAAYGYNAIARLRLTQTAATGFAEGQADFKRPKPKQSQPVDPSIRQEAEATAAPVTDPDLRRALAQLAGNVLSKTK